METGAAVGQGTGQGGGRQGDTRDRESKALQGLAGARQAERPRETKDKCDFNDTN